MYWYELAKRAKEKTNVHFFEQKNENIFRKNLDITVYKELPIPTQIIRYLPFTKKLPKRSIFHSSLYRVSLQTEVVNITTVHDFTYEYFRKGLAKTVHSLQKGFAIRKSDGVICVSENTKKDLLKFLPDFDADKIKVVYNGVSDVFSPIEGQKDYLVDKFECLRGKAYIIFVGDRSPYKNFELVVKALDQQPDLFLVIVGGKPFNPEEIVLLERLKARYFHFMGINSDQLNVLYNNAFCLLYPSSYEGFGIPVVEAMKAGCPVITSRNSSLPEVAGDAGIFLDSLSPEDISKKILLLSNFSFRSELIQRGLIQAAKFNWDKCFQETYSFYEAILKRKF